VVTFKSVSCIRYICNHSSNLTVVKTPSNGSSSLWGHFQTHVYIKYFHFFGPQCSPSNFLYLFLGYSVYVSFGRDNTFWKWFNTVGINNLTNTGTTSDKYSNRWNCEIKVYLFVTITVIWDMTSCILEGPLGWKSKLHALPLAALWPAAWVNPCWLVWMLCQIAVYNEILTFFLLCYILLRCRGVVEKCKMLHVQWRKTLIYSWWDHRLLSWWQKSKSYVSGPIIMLHWGY
jgi:hypothetical protein